MVEILKVEGRSLTFIKSKENLEKNVISNIGSDPYPEKKKIQNNKKNNNKTLRNFSAAV